MTTEQPKPASNPEQSATYPPPAGPFAYPPPPPGYPPFFAYPPPTDGQQPDANGTPAPPYPVMYPAPGMVYAFPPQPPTASPAPAAATAARPKRKQVKMACTNCAAACKRCDEARPCERCQKYGIADSCVDGQRKERKKGIKRGPYKRKNKQTIESAYGEYVPPPPEGGEWPPGTAPPNVSAANPIPFPPPEGYYPVYYPPPGAYPLPDGQPGSENGAPVNGHPPPMMPFYVGGFPPYPYPLPPPPPGTLFQIPPSGSHPPPPPGIQALTAEVGSQPQAEKKAEEATIPTEPPGVNPADVSDPGTGKKRKSKSEVKTKKAVSEVQAGVVKELNGGGTET